MLHYGLIAPINRRCIFLSGKGKQAVSQTISELFLSVSFGPGSLPRGSQDAATHCRGAEGSILT